MHIVTPKELVIPLEKDGDGYHQTIVDGIEPGSQYFYRLDDQKERPDPASRFQPQGVHGPSQVLDLHFLWEDQGWSGLPLEEYIVYELHVGTFTTEGTFDAIFPHLEELRDLGITAVELMPIAQFPGNSNWGYDGVYPLQYRTPTGDRRD